VCDSSTATSTITVRMVLVLVGRAQPTVIHPEKMRVEEIPLPLVFKTCVEVFSQPKKKPNFPCLRYTVEVAVLKKSVLLPLPLPQGRASDHSQITFDVFSPRNSRKC
jgi:hypothetical protein